MPRKCSVGNYKTNYDSSVSSQSTEKIPVYKFPSDPDKLELWLSALPNLIFKESVTKNMGVCRRHWPDNANMIKTFGRYIPDEPPSIFPGCPKTFQRQTVPSSSRDVKNRCVLSASRSSDSDELKEFDQKDLLPTDFFEFTEQASKRDFANLSIHVISENSLHFMSFDNSFRNIEFSLTIHEKFSVVLRRKCVDVSLHHFRDLLGYQYHCTRWSQLEAALNRLKNYNVSFKEEVLQTICHLESSLKEEVNDDITADFMFLMEQFQLKLTPSEGRRYSADTMKTAMKLYISNRSTYRHIRGILTLPHPKTLTANLGNITSTGTESYAVGISKQVFDRSDGIFKKCIILFDEIYIKPSIRYRSGHAIGFSIDEPNKPARTVLVFMVRSFFDKTSFVIRFVPVFSLTAEKLLSCLLNVLTVVENSGGRAEAIMSDNLSVNRKLHSLLRSQFSQIGDFAIVHPVVPERKLYLLFDPVHLLKCLRNNWETEKTKRLMFSLPGEMNFRIAHWKDLVAVYDKEKDFPVRRTTLTYAALHPSSIEKQKVSLALQVFNEKTVAALIQDDFNDTAAFVSFILRVWKILNNKSTTAYITLNDVDRKPITSASDMSLTFLENAASFFSKLTSNKASVVPGVPQQTRRVMALTKETSASLSQTLRGLTTMCADLLKDNAVHYVLLGRFQSDALEGEFGIYRGILAVFIILLSSNF